MKQCLAMMLVAVTMAGCQSPELTRRYGKWKGTFDAQVTKVKAGVFVAADPTPATKTDVTPGILQLSDRAQAAVVEKLYGTKEDAKALLTKPLTRKDPAKDDRLSFERRLVFSSALIPERSEPGDRIEMIRFCAKLDDASQCVARFTSWSRFATERRTIEYGDVTLTQGGKALASLTPTLAGGVVGSGSASVEASRTLAETVSLSRQYDELIPTLTPTSATILQRGDAGFEPPGVVVADITFALKPEGRLVQDLYLHVFDGLFSSDGTPVDADQVKHSVRVVQAPVRTTERVRATVTATYAVRDIMWGEATLTEGDDTVRSLRGDAVFPDDTHDFEIDLLNEREVVARRTRWAIGLTSSPGGFLTIDYLRVPRRLETNTLAEAEAFLRWLLANGGSSVDGRALQLDGLLFDVDTTAGTVTLYELDDTRTPQRVNIYEDLQLIPVEVTD